MAGVVTRTGGRELLALGLSGALSDGTTLAGLYPLLVGFPLPSWPELATASQIPNAVPLTDFSAPLIPRDTSTWSVAVDAGTAVARPTAFRAEILVDVADVQGVALVTKRTLGQDSLVVCVIDHEVYSASATQHVTYANMAIRLAPAPANGRSFYVREGLRELLHLALTDRTSIGSGLSSIYGHLIRNDFAWGSATPDLDLEAVAPFLVPAEHLSVPPTFERAPATWSFSIDAQGRAYARPAAPRTFTYNGETAVEVAGLALSTSPTASGAGVLLALIETSTGTLEPGNTARVEFEVPAP